MANENFVFVLQAGPIATDNVAWMRLEQRLGLITEAEIVAKVGEFPEPNDLLGQVAHFAYGREAPEQVLDGIVMSVEGEATADDNDQRNHVVRIHITSILGVLAQERDCRIFQDKDVKEIVTEVLTSLGIGAAQQAWRLGGTYPKREYCVQYNESALDFVSRLLEEEGIYYWSDKGDGGGVITFDDDSTGADPIDGDKVVTFKHGAGLDRSKDAISSITQRHRVRTGKVVLNDYDFKKPKVDLTGTAEADKDTDLELYDYPGLHFEASEGKRLAGVRLEALSAERAVFEIRAGCTRITAGKWLEIADAPDGLDGEYFITGAVHELREGELHVTATLIPKAVKFRSPRRTPVPIIDGPQTATIVAPKGSPAEEIHTDEHGRVKVSFHWDHYGEKDDTATFWMRTSQAQTSGSMILPRVGWEVIVEFLEGNPDRPIITGRVYNGKFMPPYALPEGKSRTAIQTSVSPGGGGTNQIRFEDKAGSEEIAINSHKDTTLATANNKTKSTAVDETKNVKVNAKLSVGANQAIKVTNGYLNTVGGSQTQKIGGSRKVEVNAVYGLTSAGASSISVGGGQFEMDGNPIQALLSLALKAATEAAQAAAAQQMAALDAAVSSKVDQVMGPITQLQGQVQAVNEGLNAVSGGNLGAAGSALNAAAGLPSPGAFATSIAGTQASGLDALVHGAIASGSGALGSALGLDGAGGGGASAANAAGPAGTGSGNSAADSATGPGHAVNHCSATHKEKIGSLKVAIAAAGINTTVTGARKQNVGAARVELVAGTRAETCSAGKKETALGLVILSKGAEMESVGAGRTTMVGGAILEKIGGSATLTATGLLTLAGSFHKVEASTAIVFQCGDSSVTIDGSGVTIKAAAVTVTAPKVTHKGSVAQGS